MSSQQDKDRSSKKKKASRPKLKLKLKFKLKLSWLVILVLVGASVFLYLQYREAKHKLSTPSIATTDQEVLSKLEKVYLLPKNETPHFGTVTNANKLKSNKFFVDSVNGDKLIVYGREHLGILYRPSTNMIINVGPATLSP